MEDRETVEVEDVAQVVVMDREMEEVEDVEEDAAVDVVKQ